MRGVLLLLVFACALATAIETVVVKTPLGELEGEKQDGFNVFRGIR